MPNETKSTTRDPERASLLLLATSDELARQDQKWGWPRPAAFLTDDTLEETDGRPLGALYREAERRARQLFSRGRPCWMAILGEEIGETAREQRESERITELIQVAAVALSWAQAIDENQHRSPASDRWGGTMGEAVDEMLDHAAHPRPLALTPRLRDALDCLEAAYPDDAPECEATTETILRWREARGAED